MNNKLNLFLLATILFLFGCNNQKKQIINLKLTKSVDVLNDSTFFGSSECMTIKKNIITIAEKSRILLTDRDFNLINVIGRPGNGPGEFNKVYHLIFYKDTLYAVNEMLKEMNVYSSNGKYVRNFLLPASPLGRIAIDDRGRFYLSTSYGKKPIICFENNGNVVDVFGKMFNGKTESLSRRKTILDLHIYTDKLIALNKSEMILQYYSLKNRALISEKKVDLTMLNDFNNELKYKEKIIRERANTSVSMISDSYLDGNHLYFTVTERNDNGVYINKIVKLNLANDKEINIFDITNANDKDMEYWITSLCVQNDTFFVSDASTKSLLKYVIK